MLTLFRWLLRLTVGLIAGVVLVVALLWYFAIRSLPDYNATHSVDGITAPVEIVRSTEDVPHIFGQTDADVFFALGLAHAQDRLFQMTVLRRAAQGRLSEIYGARTFAKDDLARRLGLARSAREALDVQDDRTRAALAAYADGVNQWIMKVNEGALGRGAPEFFLYPDDIAFWQPQDSLAILKLVAATSSTAIADEVLAARLSMIDPGHGPELILGRTEAPMPDYAGLFPGAKLAPEDQDTAPGDWDDGLAGYLRPGLGLGGSVTVADGARTAMGGAILANDPQGALTAPSLWYLARLQLASGDVMGATIPGIPTILSGRSDDLAWGVTPAGIDDADILIEEIQPGNIDRYRSPTGWTEFDTRTETIRIRDAESQRITLRDTGNGPLLPGHDFGLGAVTPLGHAAALSWTGSSGEDTTMSGLIGLMEAQDRNAAADALNAIVAPALNVALADQQGVTMLRAGALPLRDPASQTGGRMPAPGWAPANVWRGLDRQAVSLGAPQGLASATAERPDGLALSRLRRLMDGREVHSRDSLIAAQLDTVSPAARQILPLVGANLWFTGEPAAPGTPERQRQDALSLLAEWDGAMNEHLPEPLIYAAWMAALQDRLVRDQIGALTDSLTRIRPDFIERVFRDTGGASRWCDVIQSAPTEDCTTIARQALDQAILDLTDRFGPDVTSWRWGDVHEAHHIHPALGKLPGVGWVMNLVQPTSGGDFTLALGGLLGFGKNPYQNVTGAGYRGVYDMADPDSSVFVISTGQSGHPLSRHYDDLAGLWRRGEYVDMSLDPALARAAATGVTRLVPAGD
ncbi:penicillin acylase family protein [Paracoccus sp. TK19116]|uniref:Penicillin acylase family protein n=1 Tax=Paracoccus albicereus TaxID=2922394 RepID=A0ABT1MSC5_9RHOB|nr:penicillin acylase family protein [Paracoccus albicereus]MCQ0969781.1 penicillin acylase family protein [Paracoccus albicereus]